MTRHLFLYGTLLPELAAAGIRNEVDRLRPCGRGYVAGRLYDLGPFPGAIVDPGASTTIQGALFELPEDPAVLAALDHYEGDRLFARTVEPITLVGGGQALPATVPAWIYVYLQDVGEATLIEHGDYLRWRKERLP